MAALTPSTTWKRCQVYYFWIGLSSALYFDVRAGTYIYVFAGTNDEYIFAWGDFRKDWTRNVSQIGGNSEQHSLAVTNAREIDNALDGNVSFSGHSLGGGLASLAAVATGLEATTFNSAAISDKTLARFGLSRRQAQQASIRGYYVQHEILSDLQDSLPGPSASGSRVGLPAVNPPNWYQREIGILRSVELHSMREMVLAIELRYHPGE